MMMSRRENFGGGRRRRCVERISVGNVFTVCWICTASAVVALMLITIHHGLMVKFNTAMDVFKTGMDVLPLGVSIFGCRNCSPDMSKFPDKIRRRGEDALPLKHRFLADGEKFMYYAPHSGFNNQVMELRNALMFAKILNRTLIIPPVLDHHATYHGSCPKRRVLPPYLLRALAWMRIFDLITNSSGRYTSIADIIDISSVTPSKVKTVDLRIFLALWCGINIKASCGGSFCKEFAERAYVWRDHKACIRMLNPLPETEQNCCVFKVDNDCTSTIWTISANSVNEKTIAVEALHKESPKRPSEVAAGGDKVNSHKLQNVRRRALFTERMPDEWKAEKVNTSEIKLLDIRGSLGSNSSAGKFSVLAFGSMFSMSYKNVQTYIDIKTPSGDEDLDDLIRLLEVLPSSSNIIAAGKQYIFEEIARPFYCAQLRLLDGQFKQHWNATFQNLKAQLTSYSSVHRSSNSISLFVMTDLPFENWTTTDLKDLLDSRNLYKVHRISTRNDLIELASRRVLAAEAGFLAGSDPDVRQLDHLQEQPSMTDKLSHVELAIEEIVCACAKLGFLGTLGSTITHRIRDLRTTEICDGLRHMIR